MSLQAGIFLHDWIEANVVPVGYDNRERTEAKRLTRLCLAAARAAQVDERELLDITHGDLEGWIAHAIADAAEARGFRSRDGGNLFVYDL